MDVTRYGIYLRPDPLTCWVQQQINLVLNRQYGLVSAAAFPPHATLVGNLAIEGSTADLIAVLDAALAAKTAFTVHNKGLVSLGAGFTFDVHEDGAGKPNADFVALAAAVKEAVLPLAVDTDDYLVPTVADAGFRGHLSLASHDLAVDKTLYDEVGDFLAELIAGLPASAPSTFPGNTVALYGTDSADWKGHWWKTLQYQHIKTWTLPPD